MSNKPNIVVIMTDQQRADVSAREGFPLDTTPFLDGAKRNVALTVPIQQLLYAVRHESAF